MVCFNSQKICGQSTQMLFYPSPSPYIYGVKIYMYKLLHSNIFSRNGKFSPFNWINVDLCNIVCNKRFIFLMILYIASLNIFRLVCRFAMNFWSFSLKWEITLVLSRFDTISVSYQKKENEKNEEIFINSIKHCPNHQSMKSNRFFKKTIFHIWSFQEFVGATHALSSWNGCCSSIWLCWEGLPVPWTKCSWTSRSSKYPFGGEELLLYDAKL